MAKSSKSNQPFEISSNSTNDALHLQLFLKIPTKTVDRKDLAIDQCDR